jgi:hypothetical protein
MNLAARLAALEGQYGHRRPVVLPLAAAAVDPATHAAETAYLAALNDARPPGACVAAVMAAYTEVAVTGARERLAAALDTIAARRLERKG